MPEEKEQGTGEVIAVSANAPSNGEPAHTAGNEAGNAPPPKTPDSQPEANPPDSNHSAKFHDRIQAATLIVVAIYTGLT
jgi:hypothetical protein